MKPQLNIDLHQDGEDASETQKGGSNVRTGRDGAKLADAEDNHVVARNAGANSRQVIFHQSKDSLANIIENVDQEKVQITRGGTRFSNHDGTSQTHFDSPDPGASANQVLLNTTANDVRQSSINDTISAPSIKDLQQRQMPENAQRDQNGSLQLYSQMGS